MCSRRLSWEKANNFRFSSIKDDDEYVHELPLEYISFLFYSFHFIIVVIALHYIFKNYSRLNHFCNNFLFFLQNFSLLFALRSVCSWNTHKILIWIPFFLLRIIVIILKILSWVWEKHCPSGSMYRMGGSEIELPAYLCRNSRWFNSNEYKVDASEAVKFSGRRCPLYSADPVGSSFMVSIQLSLKRRKTKLNSKFRSSEFLYLSL